MRILVTGAEGFVGKAIVAALLEKKFCVFCLASLKSETKSAPKLFRADIGNLESLNCLDELKNIDAVIHSAGLAHQFGDVNEKDFWKVNVEGTKNVVLKAAHLAAKHFVLISSVSVYGKARQDKRIEIDEDFPCEPEGAYAQSKLEAEKIATEICEENSIPLTILRLATVVGEGDQGNTARLINWIDAGRFLWIGKGENLKSLIYKGDVAEACACVLDKKTSETEIFNVTSEPVSMKEIVGEIAKNLNKKIPKIYVPAKLSEVAFKLNSKITRIGKIHKLSETIEKWLSDDVFSGEKIALRYKFRAKTKISEAIERQVESYKNRKNRKNRKSQK
jgi:nucleoside-diphosphate-sugar epimerase